MAAARFTVTRSGAGPLFDMFAGAMIISAHAAPVTFVVSPDTHFTQCGGVPDVDKNVRGIDGINTLAGETNGPLCSTAHVLQWYSLVHWYISMLGPPTLPRVCVPCSMGDA